MTNRGLGITDHTQFLRGTTCAILPINHRVWAVALTLSVTAGLTMGALGSVPAYGASVDVMVKQGVQYYNKGYLKKAIPIFERAYQANPNNEQVNLWLARGYKKQGTPELFQKAVFHYEKVLEVNPNNMEALVDAGEVLSWNPATRDRALDYLRRAAQLDPSNARTAKMLAEVLSWEQQVQESLMYADPIADQYQDDSKWMGMYASLLARSQRADEAVSIYENVLNVDPSADPTVQEAYAIALDRSGRRQEAKGVYDRLKSEALAQPASENYERRLSLAKTAYEIGEYQDAIDLDKSIPPEIVAQRPEIPMRMARTYAKMGRDPEAIDIFQRLMAQGAMDSKMKLEYADYLAGLNLPDQALPEPGLIDRLYTEAQNKAPANADILLRRARLAGRTEANFSEASRLYLDAMANDASGRARNEYIDFLKASSNFQTAPVQEAFLELTRQYPGDPQVLGAYAEFLSWKDENRAQAMELYYNLATSIDTGNRSHWLEKLDQVLGWHVPKIEYLPLYEKLGAVLPESKNLWLGVARAYANNVPEHYEDAVKVYEALMQKFPEDKAVKSEWAALITSDPENRPQAMSVLASLVEQNPEDVILRNAYGRVLSYEGHYKEAIEHYDYVLAQDSENRDALLGKGRALLWGNKKFKAKSVLKDAKKLYPRDVDILMALAEANRNIGRYDHALRLLKEVKTILREESEQTALPQDLQNALQQNGPKSFEQLLAQVEIVPDVAPVIPTQMGVFGELQQAQYTGMDDELMIQYDAAPVHSPQPMQQAGRVRSTFDLAPPQAEEVHRPMSTMGATAQPAAPAVSPALQPALPIAQPATSERTTMARQAKPLPLNAKAARDLAEMEAKLRELDATLSKLSSTQAESREVLDDLTNTATEYENLGAANPVFATVPTEEAALIDSEHSLLHSAKPYFSLAQTASYLGEDFSLLSGRGKMIYDRALALEEDMEYNFRPELRGGYSFSMQDGEPTTNEFRHWGFPNQLSLSLHPQVRIRGGVSPRQYYIPNTPAHPKHNWATQYSWGATIKPLDRLTLDGDMALTHFYQSDDTDLTYQVQGRIDVTDRVKWTVGGRRTPVNQSLLSYAGFRPSKGPFAGQRLGQAREHGVFTELNFALFKHWDLNLGYEWMNITGNRIASNNKHQFFGSLGHTWTYAEDHSARLGYQFLYFDYAKTATTGFFDTISENGGFTTPVVTLAPQIFRSSRGTVFGGYFSPDWFVQNAFRLDLKGGFFDNRLQYWLGGSLGVQSFDNKNGDPSPTGMSSAADVLLMWNVAKWLSLYANADFLDGGGQFNRFRFGGGMILRPKIDFLSPVIGGN